MIHELADVEPGAQIGDGTKIWRWTHVRPKAVIGENCTIGQNCYIDEAVIGNNVKIQNNVSVYTGVVLEDDVFIGPSVVFTNVRKPRSCEIIPPEKYAKTIVRKGASIGANATIVCGIEIGEGAMIGAGTVVTKNVPKYVTVVGNPAGILVQDTLGTAFVISFEQYYIKKRFKPLNHSL
jgi:UDP-2-acetamido-3-amino-2,3-dideoxy-glucuronate N-acetyltransferase